MKYLLLLSSAMLLTFFNMQAEEASIYENPTDFDVSLYKHHDDGDDDSGSDLAFGSFVTLTNQVMSQFNKDIAFEVTLAREDIRKSTNNTTFTIRKSGYYKIDYGYIYNDNSLQQGDLVVVFSLHKNGISIPGTGLGNNFSADGESQSVILKLNRDDQITLSFDFPAPPITVTIGPLDATVPNNAAYIDFIKIN